MARPIQTRLRYTRDRSRLAALEVAVEKDPRLTAEQKSSVSEAIRGLIQRFMELDSSNLGPLPVAEAAERKERRKRSVSAATA